MHGIQEDASEAPKPELNDPGSQSFGTTEPATQNPPLEQSLHWAADSSMLCASENVPAGHCLGGFASQLVPPKKQAFCVAPSQ